MSLKNVTTNSKGFTIVELLIVVVVIAILAAITIVSYNGITTKANASSAKATASTLQKKIELYQASEGRYPAAASELTAADKSWTTPSTMFSSAAASATDGKTRVQVLGCHNTGTTLSGTTVTGARVVYWDYEKTTAQETPINVGSCTQLTAPLS